jgi:hypothetical protein
MATRHRLDLPDRADGDGNYTSSVSGTTPLWGMPPATTTTLTLSSGGVAVASVPPDTVVALTATVKVGANPQNVGRVNFCDASAGDCTDIHLLGTVSLTSRGTATFTPTDATDYTTATAKVRSWSISLFL